jgi:hypothetical protein
MPAAREGRSATEESIMINGYQIYDADAHVMMSPKMWDDLPKEFLARRPRPLRVADAAGIGARATGWLIEGRMEPHPYGPGAQGANTPTSVMAEFGAPLEGLGSLDLSDPDMRLRDRDSLGIDSQLLFPSSLYACMGADPFFEAAMFRAYNRYVGKQCKANPKRLKWAALLPLRDTREGMEVICEMQELGASVAVVFGTAGDRLLSHKSFTPIWDEFALTRLPLCVHMGRSYPLLDQLVESRLEAHVIAMGMPAQLGFVAVVAQGMLDRYGSLKVAFLEFGADWLFYVVGRLNHYLPSYQRDPTVRKRQGQSKSILSRRDFLSLPKLTILCSYRKLHRSARTTFYFHLTSRTARAATMPQARSLSDPTWTTSKNARFFTTTPYGSAASRKPSYGIERDRRTYR